MKRKVRAPKATKVSEKVVRKIGSVEIMNTDDVDIRHFKELFYVNAAISELLEKHWDTDITSLKFPANKKADKDQWINLAMLRDAIHAYLKNSDEAFLAPKD